MREPACGRGLLCKIRRLSITVQFSLQGMAARPARCSKAKSSLVRRLVQAQNDPARQRIRAWLRELDEQEVVVGNELFILRAGDSLMAPRDIPHKLRNSGNTENHYLIMFSPSGFEGFFAGDGGSCTG